MLISTVKEGEIQTKDPEGRSGNGENVNNNHLGPLLEENELKVMLWVCPLNGEDSYTVLTHTMVIPADLSQVINITLYSLLLTQSKLFRPRTNRLTPSSSSS